MNHSSINAHAAVFDSMNDHLFPWEWWLSDLDKIEKNGLNVFSCFSCGGGSSMGYKLAGYDVIGNVEIDPHVMDVYKKNLHPQYPFLMDVRDFLKIPKEELPGELFKLDILDGSPPCSVFSMAGGREKGWNKEKKFREGQIEQKLDDLFFWFVNIASELKPKVVVAENVAGLIKGNAKGYVNEIFKAFAVAGYETQLFLLNSANMGVPQRRERCFFVARQKDLGLNRLSLKFKENPITFGDVRAPHGEVLNSNTKTAQLVAKRSKQDKNIAMISKREGKGNSGFTQPIIWDEDIAPTLTAGSVPIRGIDGCWASENDIVNMQTFPQDYDFGNEQAGYICGMSVPPVMMAQIARQIYLQWFCGGQNGE